jgi:uncharacterized membrane protein
MNLLKVLFKRETALPIMALGFASAVNVAVVLARMLMTERLYYVFLVWNLFLAWLPLIFAALACEEHRLNSRINFRLTALAVAWLLFFPNAPYIWTDMIHLTGRLYMHFWVDLVLILMCAFTGLVIGFVSLYLMQTVVERIYGKFVSWVFIAVASALGSFGILLGRFLRYNSWDVFVNPAGLYRDIGTWTTKFNPTSVGFTVLFAAFLFLAYLMLYALTHLSPARMAPADANFTDYR